MSNPYAHYRKEVHEHEQDGTSTSCFGCKREAWEEGRSYGFYQGNRVGQVERRNINAMREGCETELMHRMEDARALWAMLEEVLDHPSLETAWLMEENEDDTLHRAAKLLEDTPHCKPEATS